MSKLITAKIDVKKIDKNRLFKGEKGTYLNLTIWINDTPDQYGNILSIQQYTKQGEDKIYLGEGKIYVKKEDTTPVTTPAVQTKAANEPPLKTLPPVPDEMDDLPF